MLIQHDNIFTLQVARSGANYVAIQLRRTASTLAGERLAVLEFEKDGVELRESVLSAETIALVKSDIDLDSEKFKIFGVRNLEKRFASISTLVLDDMVTSIASECLKGQAKLVRALFFDKTPEKNWYVTWHQDKTVALNRKIDKEEWSQWSMKDGAHHVQPPVEVLNQMVTLRLHIDSTNEDNGCLKVIPGTHREGILKQEAIDKKVKQQPYASCVVGAGGAVIMRPHILHSSSKAKNPSHRRVVHLEYSSYALPSGVSWA